MPKFTAKSERSFVFAAPTRSSWVAAEVDHAGKIPVFMTIIHAQLCQLCASLPVSLCLWGRGRVCKAQGWQVATWRFPCPKGVASWRAIGVCSLCTSVQFMFSSGYINPEDSNGDSLTSEGSSKDGNCHAATRGSLILGQHVKAWPRKPSQSCQQSQAGSAAG